MTNTNGTPEDQLITDAVDSIVRQLKLETPHGRWMLRECLKLAVLLDNKQSDYGPHNIAEFGELGTMVRMNDKWNRLKHLRLPELKGGDKAEAKNESVNDTYRDVAGYAIIALLVRSGQWDALIKGEELPIEIYNAGVK